ncbi:BLUF domain-containing protein [Mucilaginibacter kameinonensis]|uniref:BLUF domain-containing protein n=1 Tax=Mucilaginibacter kameinonensis TaxID=452286 RepID=UPI000EF7C0D5|nr:BLUF domain-containing protein [Mucilaginibacter kameinonensis]
MEYLVYVSTAKKFMSDAELLDLLQAARIKNAEHNVTGMLLYSEGTFIQALEGEKENLYVIYNAITLDSRHRNIILMVSGSVEERIFSNWSMAFASVNADVLELIEGYLNPSNSNFIGDNNHATVLMLKTFAKINMLPLSF